MFRVEMRFKDTIEENMRRIYLNDLDKLFISEGIKRWQVTDHEYIYISDRTDKKLFGSFWSVIFKLKRSEFNLKAVLDRFEWIHSSSNEKEIGEDLLDKFF